MADYRVRTDASPPTKAAKKDWYDNVKSTIPLFDYNEIIVVQVKGSNIKGYVLKENEHLKNI